MKVTALEIKRTASYEDPPSQLRAVVTLTGPSGQQSIVLSPGAIARIFDVIAAEVDATARANAKQAIKGLRDAQDEQALLTHEVPDDPLA